MTEEQISKLREAFLAQDAPSVPEEALSASEWARVLGVNRETFARRARIMMDSGRLECIGTEKRVNLVTLRACLVPLYHLVEAK